MTVRIAGGQGFWGDWLEAPVRQVEGGPIDFLMMDYLAEVTMSILQKQKARNPSLGYARDVVPLLERILPAVVSRGIRVTTNAGGVNPDACAAAIVETARSLGLGGKLKVGVVTGDDMLPRLDELLAKGVPLADMDTGRPLDAVRPAVLSRQRVSRGVAGGRGPGRGRAGRGHRPGDGHRPHPRPADSQLRLGRARRGTCWPRARSPGTSSSAARSARAAMTSPAGRGCRRSRTWAIPSSEAAPDGSFVVTKHAGTGGEVTVASVTEQLVYEMGDPRQYITPDCVADFTTIRLDQAGPDRVRVTGVRGRPATELLKVSIAYAAGFKAVGTLVYAWPDALAKAREADRVLRARLERLGLRFDEVLTEYVGYNATHGPLAGAPAPDLPEVQLRVGVRAPQREPVERFTRELAPLILNGPPSVTGFAGGRPKVEEIVAYWPALVPKREIRAAVKVVVA